MKPLTVLVPFSREPYFERNLNAFLASDPVGEVMVLCPEAVQFSRDRCRRVAAPGIFSSRTISACLEACGTPWLLFLSPESGDILLEGNTLGQFCRTAETTSAGMVYSHFYDLTGSAKTLHPLNDYRPGSVRDDFDFGPMVLLSLSAARRALEKHGDIPEVEHAGLYDLRLKVSIDHPIRRVDRALYAATVPGGPQEAQKRFSYVDPRNRVAQKELEAVFTDYLRKIDAYLAPHFKEVERVPYPFPVEASIVIPVRNRQATIAGAVRSALSQRTDFPFNVIVVDNHSTDGTTAVLSDLARQHSALKHVIPGRRDLGIGGCWNEALFSEVCGRHAVQLDSDDLYSGRDSLQKIMNLFRQGGFAMVIGSYTLVNADLEEIPPGLIDHREWTDDNGRNNALRINGLGAPRAFNTHLMRKVGFPNVSYGEDYAVALRICREYRIGRIYENLYWCRRWPGNTDAFLGIEETNRNNAFKDEVRTGEIQARQKINRGA